MKSEHPKNDGYHHGALRDALLDRALEKLSSGTRVTELSVRALAAEVGVSKGAPYRHFPSADALIAALATRGFSRLSSAMSTSSGRSLAAVGTIYVRFAAANPELYRAMYHFPAERITAFPELAETAERAFRILSSTIDGTTDATNGLLATAAWSYVHGLAELVINRLTTQLDVNDDHTMALLMSRFDSSVP
jgi:AcrR family transcriptional regulator